MIEVQKLKFMYEFTFAINVECLHSGLQTKLLMHSCTCANMQKHVSVAYDFESSVEWKISAYDEHIQEQLLSNYNMSDFSKPKK